MRRFLSVLWKSLSLTIVFVLALVVSVVMHLDTAPGLRVVKRELNANLGTLFAANLEVNDLRHVGIFGASGIDARIVTPEGTEVIAVYGVSAHVHVLGILKSVLLDDGPMVIRIESLHVRDARASLAKDAKGELLIAKAFELRSPSPPPPPDAPKGRAVDVEMPRIEAQSIHITGEPTEGFPVDASIHDTLTSVLVREPGVEVRLAHAKVDTKLPRLLQNAPQALAALWVSADLSIPSAGFGPLGTQADVRGNVGGIPLSVTAAMREDVVRANVEVPIAAGERLAEMTEAPLRGPLSLRALAFGSLSRLAFSARAALAGGGVETHGQVGIGATTSLLAQVRARHFDLYGVGASSSNLQADAEAALALPAGPKFEPSGTVRLRTFDSSIGETPLPSALLWARLDKGHLVAEGVIDEPGVPSRIQAEGSIESPISFSSHSDVTLGAITRASVPLSGSLTIDTRGTLDPVTLALSATANVQGGHVSFPGSVTSSIHVELVATGNVTHPQIVANSRFTHVGVAGIELDDVSAGGTLRFGSIHVEDVRVAANAHGEKILVLVSRVEVTDGGEVRIRDGSASGLGETVRFAGDYSASGMKLGVQGRNIELARVGRVLGMEGLGGNVSISGDIRGRGKEVEGTVGIHVERGSYDNIRNARASLEASLEDRRLVIHANGNLGKAGRFEISSNDLMLSEAALAPHALERISGHVALDVDVDFARLPRFVPALRGRDVQGSLKLTGHVSRETGQWMPAGTLAAQTYGLSFSLPPPEGESETPRSDAAEPEAAAEVPAPAPLPKAGTIQAKARVPDINKKPKTTTPVRRGLVVAGIDLAADVHVDPTSGFTGIAARLHDSKGTLVSLDGKANLPFERLLRVAQEHPNDLIAECMDTQVSMKVVVPERALDAFPSILGFGALRGKTAATIDVQGTPNVPRVALAVTGRGMRDAETNARFAADVDAEMTYDGKVVALDLDARSGPKGSAKAQVRMLANAADLLSAKDPLAAPWAANARVDLAAFPLQFVPLPSGQKVRGTISGSASLDRLHDDASLLAKFVMSDVRISRAAFTRITTEAEAKGGDMRASVHVEQKDGTASLVAKGGLDWGANLAPAVSTNRALEAELVAKNLNAGALLPFVGGALSDLDGRIDADARVSAGADGKNVKMQGGIDFREGVLGIPSVGQEFRDAQAKVTFEPGGTIRLVRATAHDATGEFTLTASAHMDDLRFDSAEASLTIPQDSPVDMAVQGQSLGEVWGVVKAKVAASKDGSSIAANVAIPSLHAKLSDTGTRSLQVLEAPDNIHVGHMRRHGVFVALPRTATEFNGGAEAPKGPQTKVTVNVAFGDDIEIRQGSLFQARFTGKLAVVSADEVSVRGQLVLTGGQADLQGKKFEIQKGTVTFNGDDPTNPVVVATAGWTAGDRTRVYADFVGPVRTGVVTLRSEPARTKSEIFALVVFGSVDGMGGNTGGGTKPGTATTAATTVAGAQVGKGIDKALDDIAGLETQTRIDTTNANNPRPELEVMISRTVSIQFGHVLGTPPLSQPDVNLGTIKWRFAPRWSLATTFGDRGKAAVDTLWNYLY
ncbi:MAG: translocation/assembly module TamB domain-containing protein [Polyangiaceae bacterium]